MRLFIRDPRDGNEYDLQTIWFENAMGASYLRKKRLELLWDNINLLKNITLICMKINSISTLTVWENIP